MGVRVLGKLPYDVAMGLCWSQRKHVQRGGEETLFLLEHPPTLTVGSRGSCDDRVLRWAKEEQVSVVHTRRGGLLTYHGPGQLIVYPVVRLRRGIVDFLSSLAGALGDSLSDAGVSGCEWRRDPAGLWKGQKKIAACGIRVSNRVVTHGFAVNLATPRTVWSNFDPCGLGAGCVVSASEVRGNELSTSEFLTVAKPHLERWFHSYVGSL